MNLNSNFIEQHTVTTSVVPKDNNNKVGFTNMEIKFPRWGFLLPSIFGVLKYTTAKPENKNIWGALAIAGATGYALNPTGKNDASKIKDTPRPAGSVDTAKVNSILSELRNQLTTYYAWDASPRCAAYERYYKNTNDAEFVEVANQYKNKFNTTLRSHISSQFLTGCWGEDFEGKVRQRMNNLNVV